MSVVNIKIGGRDYQVACGDGQEEHLRLLADEVNDRINVLFFSSKSNKSKPSEPMMLVMAALMLADELLESKKETDYFMTHAPEDNGMKAREIEAAMAVTLEDIAARIEKIAETAELR